MFWAVWTAINIWLVSRRLKNISRIGSFSPTRDENKKYLNHHLLIECPKKRSSLTRACWKIRGPNTHGFQAAFHSCNWFLGPGGGPHPPALILQLTAGIATKISQRSRTWFLTRSLQCTSPLKVKSASYSLFPGVPKTFGRRLKHYIRAISWSLPKWPCQVCQSSRWMCLLCLNVVECCCWMLLNVECCCCCCCCWC